MEWRWLNEHRLTHALDTCAPAELDDLLDALDELLADPQRPDMTAPMHGTKDKMDRTIALLPHGWVLVYTVCPAVVPPAVKHPSLVVKSFDKRFD